MAFDAPPPDPPRLLSGGHSLRMVGQLVASLVPALAAAPWLTGQAALDARRHCARNYPAIGSALMPSRAAAPGFGLSVA